MTRTELESYRQQLLDSDRRLQGEVTDLTSEVLRAAGGGGNGNLSNMPLHAADMGTDHFEQTLAVSLLNNEEQLLEDTSAALHRIESGTFGQCEECRQEIARERLRALPYIRFCFRCASRLEQ